VTADRIGISGRGDIDAGRKRRIDKRGDIDAGRKRRILY
jgi:hypothetical protein